MSELFSFPDPVDEVSARLVGSRPVPGPPKRLAQGMGFAMSSTALALAATGRKKAAYGVLAGLLGAASLEAFFGYCLACRMFPLLMKAGLVPQGVCEPCGDLWAGPEAA